MAPQAWHSAIRNCTFLEEEQKEKIVSDLETGGLTLGMVKSLTWGDFKAEYHLSSIKAMKLQVAIQNIENINLGAGDAQQEGKTDKSTDDHRPLTAEQPFSVAGTTRHPMQMPLVAKTALATTKAVDPSTFSKEYLRQIPLQGMSMEQLEDFSRWVAKEKVPVSCKDLMPFERLSKDQLKVVNLGMLGVAKLKQICDRHSLEYGTEKKAELVSKITTFLQS